MNENQSKYAMMSPLTSKVPRSIDHLIAIDTEDDTEGNMLVACVYGTYEKRVNRGKRIVQVEETFYDRKDLIRFLLKLRTPKQRFAPCTLVGFNIAYDACYFDEAIDYETVIFAGTRFICGTLKNGIDIIDIYNHGGGKSLDHWITELKMNDKGIYKTEYRKDMPSKELTEHCRNDVKAHWEMAEFFRKTYADIGISFKLTTSSAALDLYKRKFFNGMWRRPKDKFNDLERNAYYGGRTECFSRGIHRVKSYDINSAYVSAMADGWYPKPDSAQRCKNTKGFRRHYNDKGNLIIAHCTVFAPKRRVMVLPYRQEKTGKLLFPYGKFTGWWCTPELHEAEKYGYKILKVHEYILYRVKGKYLEDYANFTWEQRHMAADRGDDGMKTVWKLFGNGLYGKLAQRNPVGGHFSPDVPFPSDGDCPIVHTAADGKKWYSVQSSEKVWSANSFPCVSAFITCYTRLKLLEYLKRHESNVIYCDTDCIKVPWDGEGEIGSSDLGGVKFERDQSGWYCFLKPKLYGRVPKSFIDLPPNYNFITPILGFQPHLMNPQKDKWKIKGIGRYKFAFFDFDTMEFHATYEKPNRFKESVRRGLTRNEWVTLNKTLSIIDDKRIWKGCDSEPLIIEEPNVTP